MQLLKQLSHCGAAPPLLAVISLGERTGTKRGERPERAAYPATVITGLFLGLLALAAVGGLVAGIVMTALRLRPSRLAASGDSAPRTWATLITLVAFLALVLTGSPWFVTLFGKH